MTMPVMEPDLDAALLRTWARAIDEGPFSSLCWGERIAFGNPDSLTLLGALAAWTDRVRLVTTVIVPQLHDPVMLAKAVVTNTVTRLLGSNVLRYFTGSFSTRLLPSSVT
jgi:alkanesulfonate monooxygenase SsuD/methylene tetrahydromethanopterin reductase-like flavin-dependent oxidoreductase (luciferase family)